LQPRIKHVEERDLPRDHDPWPLERRGALGIFKKQGVMGSTTTSRVIASAGTWGQTSDWPRLCSVSGQVGRRRNDMGVFRRRYPDGQLSKDWYIDYRVNGKRYKRRIGPNKKLAEQVLMDVEVKKAKGDYLGIHEAKKILFSDCLSEYLEWAQVNKAPNTYVMNRYYADRLREAFTGYLSALTAKQVENFGSSGSFVDHSPPHS
jgi:hypothetical protein